MNAKVLMQQVAAYSELLKAADVRYNAGVGTSIDFLNAKGKLKDENQLMQSSDLFQF